MNKQTFTDWGGGYNTLGNDTGQPINGPTPVFRDEKDRRLQAFGATPDTQYPDGYLGQLTDRRGDRLGTTRSNNVAYRRGVHKGERVNPGDYLWPEEFNPMTGIQYEKKGQKFAPTGAAPVILVNDGKAGPRGIPTGGIPREQLEIINEQRRSMLRTLVPQWR